MASHLIDSLATTDALTGVFADASILAAMLEVEVALARVLARAGTIPAAAAQAIGDAAAAPDAFDAEAIARAGRHAASPIGPLVRRLTERVADASPAHASYVHWGATSQDVIDTALILLLKRARVPLEADHRRLERALIDLSDRHAGTIMLGRTLLQPAAPITFGLKAAGWCAAARRGWARVWTACDEALVLQFGGAAGTLAALPDTRLDIAAALACELDLPLPDAPWHAHRDRLAALMGALGIYAGTLGKIARDVSLLMQHEVGEVAEPGGASSAMPHKRNPAGSAIALAAAVRVPGLVSAFLTGMVQEHERAAGGWQAEWPTVVSAVQSVGAALESMAHVAEGLTVDAVRMRANFDATRDVVLSEAIALRLAPRLGRDAAAELVAAAVDESRRSGQSVVEIVTHRSAIGGAVLRNLGRPEDYLGAAHALRLRLLDRRAEDSEK